MGADEELSPAQLRFVKLSAKYVSLFALGTFTTLLSYSLFSFTGFEAWYILWSLDCALNILCLFLQYSWASAYYTKICCKLDVCCTVVMVRSMKRYIGRARRSHAYALAQAATPSDS